MKVSHLHHSGVLIETNERQIFIDCYKDISGQLDSNKKVYIMASHGHGDHWNADYLKYSKDVEQFILSEDISNCLTDKLSEDKLMFVHPYKKYQVDDLWIHTYGSTDLGVSFVIELDGKTIYHSGDLNWWHWESDDAAAQEREAQDYKAILDKFEFESFDLAFVPVDPRLKDSYYYAADYFLKKFQVSVLIPIHFGDLYDISNQLKAVIGDTKTNIVVLSEDKNTITL